MQSTKRSPTRVAAVDIGSNTLHLVVVEVAAGTLRLTVLDRWAELVRLGADVAATGAIGPERAARAEATLRAQAERARLLGATHLLGLATEGVRAAANADEMLDRFSAALGAPVTLVSGLEEAALTFWGGASIAPDPLAPLAVADLGGGSCEIALGAGGAIDWARSLPLGSGRLIDALHPADPPTPEDRAALAQAAQATLDALPRPEWLATQLIGVGGTATAMARLAPRAGQAVTRADIDALGGALAAHPAEVIAATHQVDADRARLLVGGVAAWGAIMSWLGVEEMLASECGVREGAIIAWLRAGDDWQRFARDAARETTSG